MKYLVKGCVVLLPMLFSGQILADDAQALKSKLATLDTLQAKFEQTVTDVNDKLIQQGRGVFSLAVPNQFYWHLQQPDESLIVADGTDVWIYNPFAEEVSVLDLNDAINASPIALLVHRDEATWQGYQVNQQGSCFDIKPKSIDASVVKVSVCFEDETLASMALEDQQGNLSQFVLAQQSPITDAERNRFHFVVPEGVDIDDQRLKSVD
ncbi:outer membrane lipoprotein chaperone LolA [Shewanella waksmanii]|uniref:outer membrane lipoprotein chaperone LolA n=1 Tax=Shewanella waksmanii TaxID=213783 RepID=UPI0037370AD7